MVFLFRLRQADCFPFFHFHRYDLFSAVRIKRDNTGRCLFLYIVGFQSDIAGDSVILSCLPCACIIVIPAHEFIAIFCAGRKGNGIVYFCSDIPAFHLSAICVKSDCGVRFFPCGVVSGIFLRGRMFFPRISCKDCQCFILVPAFEAVAFSNCVRKYDIRSGNDLCAVCPLFYSIVIYIGNGHSDRLWHFCKVDVLSLLFCTVMLAVPHKLLRSRILMVQLAIDQHPTWLYAVIPAKHKC